MRKYKYIPTPRPSNATKTSFSAKHRKLWTLSKSTRTLSRRSVSRRKSIYSTSETVG